MTKVSIILPAYNEVTHIESAVEKTIDALSKITSSFEIIIAEDGSTDGTDKIASDLADKYSFIVHLHFDARQGRGKALNHAFKTAKGGILCYIDVDLATDMNHLPELINAVRYEGYDFATGSRMVKTSDVKRSFKRKIASKGFNFLTRTFLKSKLYDHQCGFKAFKREPLFDLLDEVKDEHWFWDTELLVRAQQKGYKIKEFPVKWQHSGTTKVDIFKDVIEMGSRIIRLWWELKSTFVSEKKWIFVTAVFGIILLFIIAGLIGIKDVASTIASASMIFLLLSSILYLFSWPVRGFRYKKILQRIGYSEKLGFLTGTIFLSQTANVLLPARLGDIIRAFILKTKKDIPLTSGLSSLAVERIFDIFAITTIGIASYVFILRVFEPGSWVSNILILSMALISAIFVVILFFLKNEEERTHTIQKILYKINIPRNYSDKIAQLLQRFFYELSMATKNPKTFTLVFFSSLLIWFIDILTCLVVLKAFDVMPDFFVVFLAVAIGSLTKIFPITPGAIGTYEGALCGIFSLAGISPAIGFAVAVIDHLVKNMVTLIFGGAYLYRFELHVKDIVKREEIIEKFGGEK